MKETLLAISFFIIHSSFAQKLIPLTGNSSLLMLPNNIKYCQNSSKLGDKVYYSYTGPMDDVNNFQTYFGVLDLKANTADVIYKKPHNQKNTVIAATDKYVYFSNFENSSYKASTLTRLNLSNNQTENITTELNEPILFSGLEYTGCALYGAKDKAVMLSGKIDGTDWTRYLDALSTDSTKTHYQILYQNKNQDTISGYLECPILPQINDIIMDSTGLYFFAKYKKKEVQLWYKSLSNLRGKAKTFYGGKDDGYMIPKTIVINGNAYILFCNDDDAKKYQSKANYQLYSINFINNAIKKIASITLSNTNYMYTTNSLSLIEKNNKLYIISEAEIVVHDITTGTTKTIVNESADDMHIGYLNNTTRVGITNNGIVYYRVTHRKTYNVDSAVVKAYNPQTNATTTLFAQPLSDAMKYGSGSDKELTQPERLYIAGENIAMLKEKWVDNNSKLEKSLALYDNTGKEQPTISLPEKYNKLLYNKLYEIYNIGDNFYIGGYYKSKKAPSHYTFSDIVNFKVEF